MYINKNKILISYSDRKYIQLGNIVRKRNFFYFHFPQKIEYLKIIFTKEIIFFLYKTLEAVEKKKKYINVFQRLTLGSELGMIMSQNNGNHITISKNFCCFLQF